MSRVLRNYSFLLTSFEKEIVENDSKPTLHGIVWLIFLYNNTEVRCTEIRFLKEESLVQTNCVRVSSDTLRGKMFIKILTAGVSSFIVVQCN